jgi:4-hydroxybenzoate polyprenyltransferase
MSDDRLRDAKTDRELLEEALERVRRLESGRVRLEIAVWTLVALAVVSFVGLLAFGAIAISALVKISELAVELGAA